VHLLFCGKNLTLINMSVLSLGDNQFGDKGAIALANVVKEAPSLVKL
jgi:hypothetical protein